MLKLVVHTRVSLKCFERDFVDLLLTQVKQMSVFTKKLNSLTGTTEWVPQDEDYDFHQEIARSAFADMLHDTERNNKYYAGIKAVIEQTHKAGRKAHVLDIGTGTGLLAMMAARCGADTIHACEAFSPISQCAEQVIQENRLSDRITVIHKRSTDVTAGEGGDMPHRANILVTEVFDTELIGEGAIRTFNHAHKHLLEKDCLVVPTSATVYAQVVESAGLGGWNRLAPWGRVKPSGAVDKCPGAAAVHDLQLNQVSPTEFTTIVPPTPVFRFDWSGSSPIPEDDWTAINVRAVNDGNAEMVFMWWSLNMDPQGEVVLSCAPWWAHPSDPEGPDAVPWRDHWMQAVYYLPVPVPVTTDQQLTLLSSHDEFSLWFNLTTDISTKSHSRELVRPVCDCMLHVASSRTRIGMLNDTARRSKYERVLRQLVKPGSVVLSLGDGSLLGLLAATLGAEKVYHLEENVISREVMEGLVKDNNLKSKVTILDSTKFDEKVKSSVNLVVGEPFFLNSLFPWDVLRWWFLRQQFPTATCMPVKATLCGMPMQFDHLHKIRAPLGTVSGFKMDAFDELVQDSSELTDNIVEVQPLWEYPGVCLSDAEELVTFDLTSKLPLAEVEFEKSFSMKCDGVCHGVALWMEVHLDSETRVSSGPLTSPVVGRRVSWDRFTRQSVYFFLPEVEVSVDCPVRCKGVFDTTNGNMDISFSVFQYLS